MKVYKFKIVPVPKPRMTARSKWTKTARRYFKFCNDLRLLANGWQPPVAGAHIIFHLPMPKSWSDSKRKRMAGKPHQQRPDLSNLLKAVEDALFDEDSVIWDYHLTKRWADDGDIVILVGKKGKQ